MRIATDWTDYELIDAGVVSVDRGTAPHVVGGHARNTPRGDASGGEKLERWGEFVLRRPDPQAIWPQGEDKRWNVPDAQYRRSSDGGGAWESAETLPKMWTISYKALRFRIELMGFKHTGLFPEQAVNWDWMIEKIQSASKPVRVLNLFAYTGGATVAAAYAGAEVCHVDASKGMTTRAKENLELSGLAHASVRLIPDDALKFVEREARRGNKYDAIIMDPPSFGRGPKGEIWKVEEQLFSLLDRSTDILSDQPLFVLVNSYTTGLSPQVIHNMLALTVGKKYGGNCSSFELGLATQRENIILPCGSSARWER
ncbi:MAG: class I SAM-dependent methyltransferase [Candidatus Moraniibacteriota bacterium]|nr:MAG: class I SAM-dependent methyltransferase [Candidatus Moranbacteria bacterium]